MSDLEPCTDVRTFFKDQVSEALRNLEVQTGEHTEDYLVELLAGYAVSDKVQEVSTPFVQLLSEATESTGPERLDRMRNIGDAALFVSGFLSDSCDRRGVTQSYVATIGARAYGEVGRAARWLRSAQTSAHSPVFVELAQRFGAFARVLDEVREQTALCTDGALVRLYERWCATRSPRIFRRLHRRGVAPRAPSGTGNPSD